MCEEQTLSQSFFKVLGDSEAKLTPACCLFHTNTELWVFQISGGALGACERSLCLGFQALHGGGAQGTGPDTHLIPPDGGLQELSGHFENQKVMYGFCSVKDSQAALPKYVLINWVCSCGIGNGCPPPHSTP